MKILHINSYFVTGQFYENLFSLQREDNDVLVYVPKEKNKFQTFNKNDCIVSSPYNKFQKIFFFLKHKLIYKDMKEKVCFDNIDIVHAHSLFSNGYEAYKIYEEFGIPYIVAIRNSDVNFFYKYLFYLRKTALIILLKASCIVFISSAYKESFINKIQKKYQAIIRNKSVVIPNGIDNFWLFNKYCKISYPNIDKEVINLICVGNIDKNKNAITICKAIRLLESKGIKCELKLAGKCVDKRVFKKLLSFPFVEYLGVLNKETLINHYRNSDVYVMPSIHETFGLVYAEAMTQGLPIIYSRKQGFDGQYAEGEVGFSVKPRDYLGLGEKICDILNNYGFLSNKCLCNSMNYDWNNINLIYLKIYKKIIDKQKGEKKNETL